jgi:RNA polymerase sigma-70 factor (ECF subfamily)
MVEEQHPGTTQLLRAWAEGDSEALEKLTPLVYRELRRIAARLLRNERTGCSLQSADLVHEVYLRLMNTTKVDWQHRAQFFGLSAKVMRSVLVDRARRRMAAKRGGLSARLSLDEAIGMGAQKARDLIELDDAMKSLSEGDPRKAQVVELRFFGGLSVEETAEVLGISCETVMRDWKVARAWLMTELDRRP